MIAVLAALALATAEPTSSIGGTLYWHGYPFSGGAKIFVDGRYCDTTDGQGHWSGLVTAGFHVVIAPGPWAMWPFGIRIVYVATGEIRDDVDFWFWP